MKSTLVLITANYPYVYNGGEVMFVAPEVPALAVAFDQVFVAPLHAQGPRRPTVSGVNVDASLSEAWSRGRWKYYLHGMRWPGFLQEMLRALAAGSITGAVRVWRWSAQADAVARWAREALPADRPLVLYTYWRGGATLALVRIAQARQDGSVVVSRVHRYELYEESYSPPFQPWIRLYDVLDKTVTISQHGFNYLRRKGVDTSRLVLSRLGVGAAGRRTSRSLDGILRVVSCSSAIPHKRVPLLAAALLDLACRRPVQRLEWIHFGGGEDLARVRQMLHRAPPSLKVQLRGAVPNADVLAHYGSHPVDVFVLLSETEGLPVSVQEALAFGIPVVATDVGGVSEAVDDTVGRLLPANSDAAAVASALADVLDDDPSSIQERRERAVQRWAELFDAGKNHLVFARSLRALLPSLQQEPR